MFDQMIASLTIKSSNRMVSLDDYAEFYKEYIFDKLKGISLGKSFCKRFSIDNYVLSNIKDEKNAIWHIEKFYIGEINE